MDAAKRRQGAIRRHLGGGGGSGLGGGPAPKTGDDVVVVAALRTPITKARKGGFKDTPADDLVAAVLKGVLDSKCASHQQTHACAREREREREKISLIFFPLLCLPRSYLLFFSSSSETGIAPGDVGDVVIGSVMGSGSQRANECRIAMFFAGFPEEVPVRVVNRQCSSGK